jgi:hypothetical protein
LETTKSLRGPLDLEFREVMQGLSVSQHEIAWLTKRDEDGFSNMQKLIEEVGIPEDKKAKPNSPMQVKIKKLIKHIQDFMTEKAVEEAIQRKMPSGDITTLRRSMKERLPRMLHEDAWTAMQKASGPLYTAMVKAALDNNPELKTFDGAHRALQSQYGVEAVKRVGVLEKSRAVKIMPDAVTVHGRQVAIFHAEPYSLISHLIDQQAMRIGMIKEFGQGVMKNLKSKFDADTGKMVGNRGPLRTLLKTIGMEAKPYTKAELINKLLDKGITPTGGESYNMIRAVAKKYDIATSPDYLELLGRVMQLRADDVGKNEAKRLRMLARKWKGIDTKQPLPELLNAVKQRLTTDIEDNLLNRLRERYAKEGGDVAHFDNVNKVFQGLPYGWLPRNPATRSMRVFGDIMGTAHTSLAVIRNVPQTLVQVPQLAGLHNFLKALPDVLMNYQAARDNAIVVGAMRPVMYSYRSETGYQLEKVGQNFRQLVGKLSGLQWIAELNETIAATAGRKLADDWKKNGFGKGDVGVARNLRLNDTEINSLLAGLPMPDKTYRKIIQTMVAETQYTTQGGHRKAMLENIPILKSIFSYQSYTYGATRNALELIGEAKETFKTKDLTRMASLGYRVGVLAAGAYGVGVLGKMAVGLIKGQPPREEDEGWWDSVLGAIVETQLLGIGTRLIHPFEYSNKSVDRFVLGFMPQMRAIASFMEAAVGWGKYGEFPATTRWAKALESNTPIAKAVRTWTDNIAHPEQLEYQKVRNLVGVYKKRAFPDTGSTFSNEPMNPDYYGVHEAIVRNDETKALELARAYYLKMRSEGKPVAKSRSALRQSLMSRRPVDLSTRNALEFARGLPDDKRVEVMEVQKRYLRLMNRVAPVDAD